MTHTTSLFPSVFAPLRATRGRRVLLLLGVVVGAAVALLAAAEPPDNTSAPDFVELSRLVQSAVSVPLPFLGVLLAGDVRTAASTVGRSAAIRLLAARAVSAAVAGAAVGAVGVVVTAFAVGDWVPQVVPGCLVVQALGVLVGLSFGLLVRPTWLAMVLDATVPVGLWAAAGLLELTGAQRWLFPYDAVEDLIATGAAPLDWVQEGVVVLVWVVAPFVTWGLRSLRAVEADRARTVGSAVRRGGSEITG